MPGSTVKTVLSIAITATFLSGCVSEESADTTATGSSNTTATGSNNTQSTATGSSSSNTSSSSTSSGTGSGAFFNDQEGIGFANSLGANMTRLFSAAFGGSSGAIARDPSSESGITVRASSTETSTCNSGSVDTTSETDDATGELTSLSMVFDNCNSGDSISSGGLDLTTSGSGGNQQINLSFNNFATTDPSGSSSIDGAISLSGNEAGNDSSFTISGPSITMQTNAESVSFNNYSMNVTNNNATGASTIGLTADVVSSVDGTVNFDINPALSIPDDSYDYPVTGRIVMTHSDGSSLDIQADNGDASTFDYTINNAGTTTSGTELWENSDLVVPSN